VFVKAAAKFASHISTSGMGLEVNGKSILGVMMLAAEMARAGRVARGGKTKEKRWRPW